MDAAGSVYSYIDNISCKKKYMQDIVISEEFKSHFQSGNLILNIILQVLNL